MTHVIQEKATHETCPVCKGREIYCWLCKGKRLIPTPAPTVFLV